MELWRKWQELARESERAARLAESEGCYRSAASRYYYAAYQAATALLLCQRLTPPQDREAWSHDDTPALVVRETGPVMRSRDTRNDIARRLKELYRLRLSADYRPGATVASAHVSSAGRDARFILKLVSELFS